MGSGLVGRTISYVEHAASAALGIAVAYALYRLLDGALLGPEPGILAAAAGVLSYMGSCRCLKAVARRRSLFTLAPFDLPEFDPSGLDELLLTDADRLNSELLLTDADRIDAELLLTDADRLHAAEPLELDDILAELGPDSRVVRLFDRKAMPTPGQLKSRIDSHLDHSTAAPDASQALSDALAELRRSLR